MAKSHDLHELIHSLSPSEKRYFRAYASRHVLGPENSYFRLFQAITAQESYDETALLQQFQGEKFTRQFAVAKNYLYQLLLQALREFHRSRTARMRIREMLDHFELLFEKGLWRQCEKMLRRAEKAARKQDAFGELYQLVILEKRLRKRQDPTRSSQYLPELSHKEGHWLGKMQLMSELRRLHDEVFSLVLRLGQIRNPAEAQELERIMAQIPITAADQAPGFEGTVIFLYLEAYSARLKNQPSQVLAAYAAMVDHWAQNPPWQKEHPERYIRTLIVCLETQFQTGDLSGFHPVLKQIKDLEPKSPALKAQAFYFSHLLEIRYWILCGDLDRARSLRPGIEKGMLHHADQLAYDWKVVMHFNLASLAFLVEEHRQARKWCREILSLRTTQVRKDILRATRMLNFILSYIQGDLEALDHLSQSTLRFLKIEPGQHNFERTLVLGLGKASRMPQPIPQLEVLRKKLTLQMKNKEAPHLGGEEVLHWLGACLAQLPLSNYYREQVGKIKP